MATANYPSPQFTKVYSQQSIPRLNTITPGQIGLVYFACKDATIFIRYEEDVLGINIMTIEFFHPDYKPWENSVYIGAADHRLVTRIVAAMNEQAAKLKAFSNLISYNNQ